MLDPLLLILAFAACCLGPGLLLVRRLRWSPLETLCASVGLSFVLVYASAFAVYAFGLDLNFHAVATALFLGMTCLCWRDLARLARHAAPRRAAVFYVLLFAWCVLLLSLVRHYSGGTWGGDWLEHYQRALFFFKREPLDTRFINLYVLPTRPPMMNVVAAHFMSVAGPDYDTFQLLCAALSALVVLPCCLLAGLLVKGGVRRALLVAGLLAANPLFLQNATYTWTKLFSAFYVLLALALYVRAWRKNDTARMVAAFASFGAAALVHYSAGPYLLLVLLHYFAALWWRRPRRWRELAMSAAAGALILGSWFAWSARVYGPRLTFASNSAVSDAGQSVSQKLSTAGLNLVNTFIPYPARHPVSMASHEDFSQASRLGLYRDYVFLIYQTTLPFAFGLVGGLLVPYVLMEMWRRRRQRDDDARPRRERLFWLALVLFVIPVGVAAHGEYDRFGLAHNTLQPLVLLGLTLLAAALPNLPRGLRMVALAGCLLDFGLFTLPHFTLQNRVFPLFVDAGGKPYYAWSPTMLSRAAQANSFMKETQERVFWGDIFGSNVLPIQTLLVIVFALMLGAMGWALWSTAAARRPVSEAGERSPPPPSRAAAKAVAAGGRRRR